jgi:hypothetical protein
MIREANYQAVERTVINRSSARGSEGVVVLRPVKNRDVNIVGEGLQNFGLKSTLMVYEEGGIFIVSHLKWHSTTAFTVSFQGVAYYETKRR